MIIKMSKITIFGLLAQRDLLIKRLIKLGVIQVENANECYEGLSPLSTDTITKQVAALEADAAAVAAAIRQVSSYSGTKKGLFPQKRALAKDENRKMVERRDDIRALAYHIGDLTARLGRIRAEENRLDNAIAALRPWQTYDIRLSVTGTRSAAVMLGTFAPATDMEALKGVLDGKPCVVEQISANTNAIYASVIAAKQAMDEVDAVLREYGFSRTEITGYQGTAMQEIAALEQEKTALDTEREAIIAQITASADRLDDLKWLADSLTVDRDRKTVYEQIARTESTVVIAGYLPEHLSVSVKEDIEKRFKAAVVLEAIGEGEEFPVLLKNHKLVEPFEAVTQLYSMPKASSGVDPNAVMAPFYFLFFGLMLSDAAYGLILSVAGFFMLWKFKPEGMMRKIIALLAICGISTFVWGALLGGWFGNLTSMLTGGQVNIPPIWFDPLDNPMKLLVWSFVFGFIHIYTALVMNIYSAFKNGDKLGGILDNVPWLLVLIGLPVAAVPMAVGMMGSSVSAAVGSTCTQVGVILLAAGVALVLLTGGHREKGIKKITKGLSSLYGITGYVSDVLSYSRLLALGLSTGVISMVVNTMGTLAGVDNVFGITLVVVVFLVGHALNFAINVLGAYVHACRLQYVEFFGKFYEGGGKAFKPFKQNTKYVNVKE